MQINPFRLERYFAKYEFKAPYLLCASDCESMTIAELFRMEKDAAAQFEQLWLGYGESAGHPDLRAAIASLYTDTSADEILVHTGAEEAIFIAMNVLLKKGDHVIVHSPCYRSLKEVAVAIGCRLTLWEADPQRDWSLDIDVL